MEAPNVQRFSRESQRTRAINAIGAFCVVSGAVFGLLAIVASSWLHHMVGPVGLVFALVIGATVGFVSSTVAIPFLLHRDLRIAKPIIAWVTGLAILIWFGASQRSMSAFVGAPFVFLACVLAAWRISPRVYLDPGVCRRCGYDLRESAQFGRCPECELAIGDKTGTFDYTIDPTKPAHRKFLRRSWLFLLRHPLVPLLFLVFALTAQIVSADLRRSWRMSPLVAALRSAAVGNALDLDALTNFEWDHAYLYGPYANLAVPIGVSASSWQSMTRQWTHPGMVGEGQVLTVFVRGSDVV